MLRCAASQNDNVRLYLQYNATFSFCQAFFVEIENSKLYPMKGDI